LERVHKGLDTIDSTDHVRICFHEGEKRLKAVSTGAFAISKDVIGADERGSPG
jgi:hypothetical protein